MSLLIYFVLDLLLCLLVLSYRPGAIFIYPPYFENQILLLDQDLLLYLSWSSSTIEASSCILRFIFARVKPILSFVRSRVKEEVKKRGGGGFTKPCSLSPELQKFTGVPELARTEVWWIYGLYSFYLPGINYNIPIVFHQVVKQLWAHIRENNLQDPSNRRKILCDDILRGLFGVDRIDMFQMNKALTKHIWPLESDAGMISGILVA